MPIDIGFRSGYGVITMDAFSTVQRLKARTRQTLRSSAISDALIAALASATIFLLAMATDAFEEFYEFSRRHETYELDEILVMLLAAGFGCLIFAIRRMSELRREVARSMAAEREVTRMALHDSLTGLPNRRLFEDRLNTALARARRDGEMIAAFMVDLDRFKPVNDLHGHETGDRVLSAVAERIGAIIREQDSFARFGGDEFAILQQGISQPLGALRLARRLVSAMEEPFDISGTKVAVGLSAGIALCPVDAGSVSELLRRADIALFRAKASGRGSFCFFEQQMDDHLRERAALERDLALAIAQDSLEAVYQPIVDLGSGEVIGFEALARWNHSLRGPVSPETFVSVAEDSGQICALGEAILRRACRDALNWPKETLLSVNVSPLQFRNRRLAMVILNILAQEGFPPFRLEVEVTENALFENPEAAAQIIGELKAAGVCISLDDFGTGYSSIAHLRDLPFDKVKIDRSFIGALERNADGASVVRAIIVMCQSLGLPTVAEGIEDEDHRTALLKEGCVLGQGYLFGRPAPNDCLVEQLAKTQLRRPATVGA